MWKLRIEKIENGYILSHDEEVEDNVFETMKEVIEEEDDEKVAMKRLLEKVAEFFGIQYDKYAEKNLNITWDKKGHRSCKE